MQRIKSAVRSTRRSGADAEIGGFGGVFDLEKAGFHKTPVLVGAIDGVGTKLKVAQNLGKHDTIGKTVLTEGGIRHNLISSAGIDLVAMNVNDLVVQGAEPLFFLDCYSCSKLDVPTAASFVSGVAEGCRQAKCALLGGETAEMPGLFSGSDYDVVGAAVGALPAGKAVLPRADAMTESDVLLGLASSGLHSNGFSLVRKIIELQGLAYTSPAPWDETTTVGLSLLTPTRIYIKSLLGLVQKDLVLGMAHITGGGLTENVPRMLPSHLAAEIDVSTWPQQPVFEWLRRAGNLERAEFARALNAGIGMVLVVKRDRLDEAMRELEGAGETVYRIGRLVRRDREGCILVNLDAWK